MADITKTSALLHGEETQVHADAGYTGVEKETLKAAEKVKASVRAFVEHPFHILKNIFGHRKVRYRGLARNGHQLHTLFALANVVIGGRTA